MKNKFNINNLINFNFCLLQDFSNPLKKNLIKTIHSSLKKEEVLFYINNKGQIVEFSIENEESLPLIEELFVLNKQDLKNIEFKKLEDDTHLKLISISTKKEYQEKITSKSKVESICLNKKTFVDNSEKNSLSTTTNAFDNILSNISNFFIEIANGLSNLFNSNYYQNDYDLKSYQKKYCHFSCSKINGNVNKDFKNILNETEEEIKKMEKEVENYTEKTDSLFCSKETSKIYGNKNQNIEENTIISSTLNDFLKIKCFFFLKKDETFELDTSYLSNIELLNLSSLNKELLESLKSLKQKSIIKKFVLKNNSLLNIDLNLSLMKESFNGIEELKISNNMINNICLKTTKEFQIEKTILSNNNIGNIHLKNKEFFGKIEFSDKNPFNQNL